MLIDGGAIARTANLCRALGLLIPGSDWPDRRCQLTPVGTATALEALRTPPTIHGSPRGMPDAATIVFTIIVV